MPPGKGYQFRDSIKDAWANLFEYRGSLENVCLRFSVEKLGIRLEDAAVTCGGLPGAGDGRAWERFLEGLREKNRWGYAGDGSGSARTP